MYYKYACLTLTRDAGTKRDENHRCYGVFYAQGASEVRSNVADYRRNDTNSQDADDEAQITTSDIWKFNKMLVFPSFLYAQ